MRYAAVFLLLRPVASFAFAKEVAVRKDCEASASGSPTGRLKKKRHKGKYPLCRIISIGNDRIKLNGVSAVNGKLGPRRVSRVRSKVINGICNVSPNGNVAYGRVP